MTATELMERYKMALEAVKALAGSNTASYVIAAEALKIKENNNG